MYPQFRDYVELFEETGCLGPRTILAHAIHMSDDEYKRMAKAGAKIAHCPTSNFFLKSGWMPMARVEKAGGARALSMEKEIGNFSAGKFADFCVVDVSKIDPKFKLFDLSTDEVLSLLMYRGDGNAVIETFVAGEKLDVDAI